MSFITFYSSLSEVCTEEARVLRSRQALPGVLVTGHHVPQCGSKCQRAVCMIQYDGSSVDWAASSIRHTQGTSDSADLVDLAGDVTGF